MDDFPDAFLEKLEDAHNYDGRYISARCPFHSESRPSFLVYPDKYRCLSCGVYGNTSDLLSKLDGFHFVPKPETYHGFNPFSKWLKDNPLYKILEIASMNIPISYLKNRGIDADVQNNLHLGLLDGWITFPIFSDKHKVIGAVARAGENSNAKSKYILPKSQDANMLYVPSWDRIAARKEVYVTFGILDSITLFAAGFASMSTTTGKRIAPSAFDKIRKKLIFLPDEGESPEALKIASKLGWRGKVVQLAYPDGCKDVNDLLWKKNYTLQQLKELINEMG